MSKYLLFMAHSSSRARLSRYSWLSRRHCSLVPFLGTTTLGNRSQISTTLKRPLSSKLSFCAANFNIVPFKIESLNKLLSGSVSSIHSRAETVAIARSRTAHARAAMMFHCMTGGGQDAGISQATRRTCNPIQLIGQKR